MVAHEQHGNGYGHDHDGHDRGGRATTVLHVGGLHYASEKAVVERALGRQEGVLVSEANPVAQTATVEYDPAATSVEASPYQATLLASSGRPLLVCAPCVGAWRC